MSVIFLNTLKLAIICRLVGLLYGLVFPPWFARGPKIYPLCFQKDLAMGYGCSDHMIRSSSLQTQVSTCVSEDRDTIIILTRQEVQFWSSGALVLTISSPLTTISMPFTGGLHVSWLDRGGWWACFWYIVLKYLRKSPSIPTLPIKRISSDERLWNICLPLEVCKKIQDTNSNNYLYKNFKT